MFMEPRSNASEECALFCARASYACVLAQPEVAIRRQQNVRAVCRAFLSRNIY